MKTRRKQRRPDNQSRSDAIEQRTILLFALALIFAIVTTFWNSQSGVFLLDDFASIHQNETIRKLWPPWAAFNTPNRGESVAGRPVANWTLAFNYAVGGLSVRGYHVVNIALHVVCALLAFGVIRRLLRRVGSSAIANDANLIAFALVGIWGIHPLQSEVVDYIVARTESLMAACYLACVFAAIRAHESLRFKRRWYAVSISAAALGMLSKESMATAPVAVLLIDRAFIFSSFRDAFRTRRSLYLGLCASWLLLIWLVADSPRANSAGFGIRSDAAPDVSVSTYLQNQAGILPHYFKLLFWPSDLVLDYGYVSKASNVLPHAVAVAAFCVLAIGLWFASPQNGVALVLCLLLLAPTTLVPIVTEVGAERRMYLPSLCIIALLVAVASAMIPRRVLIAGVAALMVVLAVASVKRNAEYSSTYRMWHTVVERRPHGRAYLNLAVAANDAGHTSEVLPLLRQAAVDFPDAEYPLAERLYLEKSYIEAIEHLETFLRSRSTHFQAESAKQLLIRSWTDLAIEHGNQGRLAEANAAFLTASKLDLSNPDLLRNVATSFFALNRFDEAKRYALEGLQYRRGDQALLDLLAEIRRQQP